ncbi:2TM domain-containing protein [uncultured Eudoraea sp.]|uniref:2TM domain-containing protein n=1 Tax=uncultured Eudoraea sp. TaxID=1035614 RepID=UPI0026173B17|nr:2TM domain-containing protein [uncultured Eudoraea sp.]
MENNRRVTSFLRAKEQVKAIKEFYASSILYCIVIPILIWINYETTSFSWAVFPALGWGFGMVVTGMAAYGINPLWGKVWEQRKIQELINKEGF